MISTRSRFILTAAFAALVIMACAPKGASAQKAPRPSDPAPNGPSAQPGAAVQPASGSADRDAQIDSFMRKAGITPLRPIAPPDFSLPTLSGSNLGHKDFKGKALLLNFWATWCPPCRAEMPSMEKTRKALHAEGTAFDILAVSVQEEKKTVQDFLASTPYSFPIVLDTKGAVSGSFVNGGIPTSYIMDASGMARGFVVGSIDWGSPAVLELFRLLSR